MTRLTITLLIIACAAFVGDAIFDCTILLLMCAHLIEYGPLPPIIFLLLDVAVWVVVVACLTEGIYYLRRLWKARAR